VKIYDKAGNEQDWDWVEQKFGPVGIVCDEPDRPYGVSELREVEGPADLSVYVRDENGNLQEGVEVAFWWPDAPFDEGAMGVHCSYRRCVTGKTNHEGRTGLSMGSGSYYFPWAHPERPTPGPHAVWLYGERQSPVVTGLGMLGETEHIHLDVTMTKKADVPPPPPPPPPPPWPPPDPDPDPEMTEAEFWQGVLDRLDRIIELLEGAL
jgi:hypothetical protein